MADPRDPFGGHLDAGRSGGRRTAAPITIAPIVGTASAQVQAWPGRRAELATALAPVGIHLPEGQSFTESGGRLCGRIAPGRYLVLSDDTVADVAAAVPGAVGAVADLSHARAGVRITGPAVEALMAKAAAIDFSVAAFPPGRLAQTSIHHMGCLVLRRADDVFDLYVLTSFAVSFADWLTDAAREFGWTTVAPAGLPVGAAAEA
ncbi:heterotetrameric sarcosine oxidase gamma subunit [Amorphus suaedae]